MSRNRRRPYRPPLAQAQPEQPAAMDAAGALPRPIKVDASRLEIPDIGLFQRLEAMADVADENEQRRLVMEMAPMLDRLVVGGLAGFRLHHMAAVITEVTRQLGEAADVKN